MRFSHRIREYIFTVHTHMKNTLLLDNFVPRHIRENTPPTGYSRYEHRFALISYHIYVIGYAIVYEYIPNIYSKKAQENGDYILVIHISIRIYTFESGALYFELLYNMVGSTTTKIHVKENGFQFMVCYVRASKAYMYMVAFTR